MLKLFSIFKPSKLFSLKSSSLIKNHYLITNSQFPSLFRMNDAQFSSEYQKKEQKTPINTTEQDGQGTVNNLMREQEKRKVRKNETEESKIPGINTNISAKSKTSEEIGKNIQQSDSSEKDEKMVEEGDDLDPRFNKFYSYVISRIRSTYEIYLKSDPKDRENILETSRFYYMKKEVDKLTDQELESLKKFFELYLKETIHEYKKENTQVQMEDSLSDEEQVELSKDRKLRKRVFHTKEKVIEIIQKDTEGTKIFSQFLFKFLNFNNPDLLSYIKDRPEEVDINKFRERELMNEESNQNYFVKRLNLFRIYYKTMLISHGILDCNFLKLKKKSSETHNDKYLPEKIRKPCLSVFGRVVRTCKTYSTFNQSELDLITSESRFFYIHQRVMKLTEEEKEDFFVSLYLFNKITNKATSSKTLNYTLTKIDVFVGGNAYGRLIVKLVLDFLDPENPDFKYFINPLEDEYKIGIREMKHQGLSLNSKSEKILFENVDMINLDFGTFLLNALKSK